MISGLPASRTARIVSRRDQLYRLAFSWCHEPDLAEDLVQEAMERALRRRRQLRALERLDSWLFGILSNCFRDHLRRETRELARRGQLSEIADSEYVSPMERVHAHRTVYRAMRSLTADQRMVISLVELTGLSYAEVAEVLEIPVGTVMSRLSRARAALKHELLDSGQDSGNVTRLVRR